MMREVLTRRFSRLLKEAGPRPDGEEPGEGAGDGVGETIGPWPDLVLIDGGPGQLAAVRGVLDELGIADLPLVGVAKGVDRDAGRETFHVEGRAPFRLPVRDPVLYFVQRLRDEAHRFAIGTHRARRSRELVANPLDEVAGVGPTRKRALLRHFGTAKAIARAGVEDLMAVDGISESMAKAIFAHFHEGGR
jgi:excinuclease ABC subunit C